MFNSRLQPTQIALGTVQSGTDKLKLNFNYGTTTNNGNVQSQTITVPTEVRNNITYNGFTATQNYGYDSLNRIEQATETVSGQSGNNWQQTFDYDRYGNRTFDELNTTTLPKNCVNGNQQAVVCANMVAQVNPSANTGNNRLNGYTFDNGGNTILDAQSRKFTYDGENKQVKVETVNGGGTVTATHGIYFFDGDGKRVKKIGYENNQIKEITIFVYDAGGKMIAEYSTLPNPTPQVSYLTTDHLGSPRINTDENGKVIARHDFQPFGEEIQRPSYGMDDVRQKFTSYERDNETELDFAQARMYANKLGRFTGVDAGPFTPADPQNFNRYSYVQNSPMKFTDPSGNELNLNGNAADDFLNFLRDKSGLDLIRDTKTGKITVKKGSKRNEKGSKQFANLLKNIIGASAKLTYDVKQNESVKNTLYDDGEAAVIDTQKKTVDGTVDFGDIKETDKQAPELATTVVAHFLYEGLRLANGAPFTGDLSKGFTSLDAGAHLNALVYETKILSEYTGQEEKLGERRDVDYQKTSTINFIYTSVQYDVVIKSTASNAATIDKITKTKPSRAPQYPPGQ